MDKRQIQASSKHYSSRYMRKYIAYLNMLLTTTLPFFFYHIWNITYTQKTSTVNFVICVRYQIINVMCIFHCIMNVIAKKVSCHRLSTNKFKPTFKQIINSFNIGFCLAFSMLITFCILFLTSSTCDLKINKSENEYKISKGRATYCKFYI